MGRGGPIYLSYTALVLLCKATGSSAGLWDVHIALGPAPPAESGPAFSADATRNRAELPYEIVAIVGSYLGTVLLIGTLLLTIGKRSRKEALSIMDKPTELVKPVHRTFDPSPISPSRSFRSWGMRKKRSEAGSIRSDRTPNMASPGTTSVASFDQSVIEQHKRKDLDHMAQLWANAVEFDDERTQQQHASASPEAGATFQPRRNRPIPLALQRVQTSESGPGSPQSPKSPYYAVPPPSDLLEQLSPHYQPRSPLKSPIHARAVSGPSDQAIASSPGKPRKGMRRSLKARPRELQISPPIPGIIRDNDDGARTPLSPVFQPDRPPPDVPSSAYTPTTPGTMRSFEHGGNDEQIDQIRELPLAYPQRASGPHEPQSTPPAARPRPPALRITSPPRRNNNVPVGHVNQPLAFRQMAEQQREQGGQLSPTAGGWSGLGSPRLQRTDLQFNPKDHFLALTSAGIPVYSPYQQVAVLKTPMTPHFTTRAERKQKEKEEKTIRGAVTEEDQVPDDKDMWDGGY